MAKEDNLFTMTGKVSKKLPNRQFKVVLDENNHEILTYLGGYLKKTRIQLIEGDKVEVEMSTYDLGRGRITNRLTK